MTSLQISAVRVPLPQPKVRVVPVIVFALAAAAVIAWALRENARFLPRSVVPLHNIIDHGHGSSGYVEPAPVTGSAVANYPGLVMFAIHLMAVGIVAVAWLVRRRYGRSDRSVHSVSARLVFAVFAALAAALVTLPVATMSLGTAILFSGTLTAAMTVMQYTFVLAVVGVAVIGVP
ncbi:hypothetical protein [Actinocrispum wychmicini]|uniref:Uncharacterized protein n=1 Tax=Actinocrispum wychmicini TaxID=1213861 RepID=A0A4R2J361_9PSEU|nr:hypothetical protein [Actinocrispum wychmicini]TCO52843.1 hypothetical protein EV192_11137 [Actinocrispum wychmicini]